MKFFRNPLISGLFAVAASLGAGSFAYAQAGDVPAGQYITSGGWGVLDVDQADEDGLQAFEIVTVGSNFHTCGLNGQLRDGQARLADIDEDCIVSITPTSEGLHVASDGARACRSFCGARADFEGLYLRPAPGCSEDDIANTRVMYEREYNAQRYSAAYRRLQPVLVQCQRTLSSWTQWDIAIDLGAAALQMRDQAACREALLPIMQQAQQMQADDFYMPPHELERLQGSIESAQVNAQRCGISFAP